MTSSMRYGALASLAVAAAVACGGGTDLNVPGGGGGGSSSSGTGGGGGDGGACEPLRACNPHESCQSDCSVCFCLNGEMTCNDLCSDAAEFPVCPPNEPITGVACASFEGSRCRYYARCITSCICTQSANPVWVCAVSCDGG